MYLYTVNAFPYGAFKDTRRQRAGLRAGLAHRGADDSTRSTSPTSSRMSAPEGIAPSIQTAPLGFKPRVTGPDVVASYTEHVLRVAAHLVGIEARTGQPDHARARAGAPLLSRDHRRNDRLLHDPSVHRHRRRSGSRNWRTFRWIPSDRRLAPASWHRLRHRPSGRRLRGHPDVADRSWWTRAFRSSSCRKSRRCTCRR